MKRSQVLEMTMDPRVKSDADVERDAAHGVWFAGVLRKSAGKACVVPPWIAPRYVELFKAGWRGVEFEAVFCPDKH